MYPAELTQPMKDELTRAGFSDLNTPDLVDEAISKEGTTLVVINSVCGCAAGSLRPGVVASLAHDKLPTNLTTTFAGVDRDAVDRARKYMLPYPPSSPSVALFKGGRLVHMIERHHIEGNSPQMIATNLAAAYDEFC